MSSSDRRPYLTATVLDQAFLDNAADNLENQLQMIVEIAAPESFARRVTVQTMQIASPGVVEAEDHRFTEAQAIKFEGAGTVPNEITLGTTYYTKNLDFEEFNVSTTPGGAAIDFTGSFAGPISVYGTDVKIRASDRNIPVGARFYQALTQFPVIKRTLGEWLDTTLEFSSLQFSLSNVDERFNAILPSGASYAGFVGRSLVVKLGLRDVSSTYLTLFDGEITPVAGFSRTVKSINFKARDRFDALNVSFPTTSLTRTNFPDVADNEAGLIVPYILGDWTTDIGEFAQIPAIVVNGADDDMNGNTSRTNNVRLIISTNDLSTFDTTKVYLRRGDSAFPIDSADVITTGAYPTSGALNARFEIDQNGTTVIEGGPFEYEASDEFLVRVKGTTLGGGTYDDNIVEQAKKILSDFGSVVSSDFDANVNTFRDKAAPAQSAISLIKSRVWIQEQQSVMEFILSMLEQVRLEIFISRDLKLKINAIHFDEFEVSPSHIIRNHDIKLGTFQPAIDERNNFNRANAFYSFNPITSENSRQTSIFRNQDSIDQSGREISKSLEFPNLYVETDVTNQLKEVLRLASAETELIDTAFTWRSLLKEPGDFVKLSVTIASTKYDDVPCMVREIGVDPKGIAFPVRLWSFQLFPFQSYSPGGSGIVSSDTQTITEET